MKFENMFEFSMMILAVMSEYWDALFSFNSLISVSISLKLTSLKLKTPFLLHLFLIARMLGCFLYLRIVFKVRSLTFFIIGSKSEHWEMLRFFAMLPKKWLKTSKDQKRTKDQIRWSGGKPEDEHDETKILWLKSRLNNFYLWMICHEFF